jgi:hypothetical protein
VNRARIAVVALLATGMFGCSLLEKLGKKKEYGSCTRAKDQFTGGTSVCRGYEGSSPSCLDDETKSDKPCPRDGFIVAGCKKRDGFKETEWVYSDPAKGGTATVERVGTFCNGISRGDTILPDGSQKKGTDVVADEAKKYEATHGTKARATLANVATIAAKLPTPTNKLDLQGLKGDVLLVHKEDLGDLESPKKIDYRIEEAGKLASCSRMLNKRPLQTDKGYDIEYCAKNPFIGVISITAYDSPVATGSSVSGNTKTTYVKRGRIDGDLLLFRSDNGKYLGSIDIGTSNSSSDITSPQIMQEKLLESFPGAVHSQMKKAAPNITNTSFNLKKN